MDKCIRVSSTTSTVPGITDLSFYKILYYHFNIILPLSQTQTFKYENPTYNYYYLLIMSTIKVCYICIYAFGIAYAFIQSELHCISRFTFTFSCCFP